MILAPKKTDLDIIAEHLLSRSSSVPLSPEQEEKLKRLEHCSDLIRQYGSRLKVVPMMIKRFDLKKNQAYEDFNDAHTLFAPRFSTGGRNLYVDIIIGFLMEDRKMAREDKDWKSAIMASKAMLDAVEKFMGDAETLPYEKFQPHVQLIGFFPELSAIAKQIPENYMEIISKTIERKKRHADVFDEAEIIPEHGS